MSSPSISPPTTGLGADAQSVAALLMEEQRRAHSGARRALRRMRGNARVRDVEGLRRLERFFGLARAAASYRGLVHLRGVLLETDRLVDRLTWLSIAPPLDALAVLEAVLDFVYEQLSVREAAPQVEAGAERAQEIVARLQSCVISAPSELPEQMSDEALFAADGRAHIEACREALVAAADASLPQRDAIDAAFRAMHTLKGNAGLLGYAEFEALGRAAEAAFEGIRSGELSLTPDLTIAMLNLLEKASHALLRPTAFQWLREAAALDTACAEARWMAHRTRIGALLVQHQFVSQQQVELVLAIKREPLGQALILLNALSEQQLAQALSIQSKLRSGAEVGPLEAVRGVVENVPVARERMDRLNEALSELKRLLADARPEVITLLNELQGTLDALHSLPLRNAFRRTAVMMRALAERQHKPLRVSLHGEDIELPRPVKARVAEMLMHLGRNAVDHGIEHEVERVASGKSEVAQISLIARSEGETVVIELIDDGRGLQREQILARALALGLIAPAQARALSDAQAFALVFAPGFSTAVRPTDTSGRGVGLDAVKHAIEELGGEVSLVSEPGRGTRVRLVIPLRGQGFAQGAT